MGSGGGPKHQTTTQKIELPEFEKRALTNLYGQAQNLHQNFSPTYFPTSTVAGTSPYTDAGVAAMAAMPGSGMSQGIMQAAGQLSQAGDTAPGAFEGAEQGQAMFGVGTPGSNPITDQLVQRTLAANNEAFGRDILPQIQQGQVANNAYGGTRGAIAEGRAAADLGARNADTAARIYQGQLQSDQQLNLAAGQLGGQMAGQESQRELARDQFQGQFLPVAQALQEANLRPLMQAGQIDQGTRQSFLDDEVNRWNFTQQQPYIAQQMLQNAVKGGSGANTTTETAPAARSGGLSGALGGGVMGAGMASMLGLSGPVGWGLAGLGALAGII